jgi:hypothetical protein
MERAEYWRQTATILAEHLLEQIALEAPERRALTSFVGLLRDPSPDALLAAYRDWRTTHGTLTAGLVYSGRLREARLQWRLAEWIVSLEEAQ